MSEAYSNNPIVQIPVSGDILLNVDIYIIGFHWY